MKLTGLLLILTIYCSNLKNGCTQSITRTTINQELLERAASHLAKLSAFQRRREPQQMVTKVQPQDNKNQSFPAGSETIEDILEAQNRIGELRASALESPQDPSYQASMQDRIKRSFISGIANKLIGGVVGAASGASRGIVGLSSSNPPSEYGPYGHSYQSKFEIGDFAKAIINTLIQAIKAIGGGAIAGGGALVKGGGYLVSAKGQIISSAGNAISTLGKSIASSAIIASPKPVYGYPGYSYNHPQGPSQDSIYDGPPPNVDAPGGPENAYNSGHSSYASPSNDDGVDDPAGILIVKATKPGGQDDHPPASSLQESNPSLSALEESFGGLTQGPSSTITKLVGILNSGQPTISEHDQNENYYSEHKDQQPQLNPHSSTYHSDSQLNQNDDNDHNTNYQAYQANSQSYDSYGMKLQPHLLQLTGPYTTSHETGQDHQPQAYQQIQSILDTHLDVPKIHVPEVLKDPASFVDYHYREDERHSKPLKIPNLDIQQNSLDHSYDNKVGSLNQYGMLSFVNSQLPIIADQNNHPLHNAMGFDHSMPHPAPIAGGLPAFGVWGRMRRRTSGPSRRTAIIRTGLEMRRFTGYPLINPKMTRI